MGIIDWAIGKIKIKPLNSSKNSSIVVNLLLWAAYINCKVKLRAKDTV
jgi:hypothetical protein